MKFRMAERSLFAILLRSPWWISLALAGVIALIARLALPAEMFWFGAMGGFPFLVIAVMAARRQMKEPSAARVQQTLEAAGAMSWRETRCSAMPRTRCPSAPEPSRSHRPGSSARRRDSGFQRRSERHSCRWRWGEDSCMGWGPS